jgi:hypothetical protein
MVVFFRVFLLLWILFFPFCEERDMWLMAGVEGLLFLSSRVGR